MQSQEHLAAGRKPSLVLISLTLFLLLLPLTLTKPGLPAAMKADEAAYYLASMSLWLDGDLMCEDLDVRRLFREYSGTESLNLMSKRRGDPFYFSVPITYPLVATPFVALLGANGMVFLNAALLMAMVWMGVSYLRRHNGETIATLFAASFFLLSTSFVYVFWLQAEVFYMACVMASFYLLEGAIGRTGQAMSSGVGGRRLGLQVAAAGACLAAVVYGRPMLIALVLPMLYLFYKARSWRGLAVFTTASLLTVLTLTGTAYALTDQVWPYFGRRVGVGLSSPVDYMERRVAPRLESQSYVPPSRQVLRAGEQAVVTVAATLRQGVPEFLLGRHGGFLVYMPFAALSIVFFLLQDRRSVFRWLLLGATVLTAVLFMTLVRGHWLGGGGFIGNRYFATVYPSFLFLVRRLRPPWLVALGYAAAAVFLGPLLLTPLGAPVVEPTLQAHVRNQPFPRLPLEWSMVRALDGYRNIQQSGANFHGRRDEIVPHQDEIWVQGARRVEMSMTSPQRDQSFVFDLRNLAPDNQITICLDGDCKHLTFDGASDAGSKERVTFEPGDPETVPQTGRAEETYRYSLTVESEWGEQPRWRGSGDEHFYLGAAITYLGSPSDLAHDLQSVEWLRVDAPPRMDAGNTIVVVALLRNSSSYTWPSEGPARVRIGYHWLSKTGETLLRGGRRTELPSDIEAGQEFEAEILVDAPESPGGYVLALDLVRERVRWFSAVDDTLTLESPVEVIATLPDLETSESRPGAE